ncbi:MAG: hypothetical protein HY813_01990 [Candidatus Portnoybacteria bacterium]|nr:hypothetical protein [Candidatus Portnoybacteria bacterium]
MIYNLLAAAAILINILSVYLIIRFFARDLFNSGVEIFAAVIPLSLAVIAAITSLFGLFLPAALSGLIAFLIIIITGIYAFVRAKKENLTLWPETDKIIRLANLFSYGFLIIILIFLCLLVLNSFLAEPDGSFSFSSGAIVDAPYHLAQIIRFGTTHYLDFDEPNFSGEFIRYPFFVNLYSSLLLKLNASVLFAFHAPLLLLLFSSVFLLFFFFRFVGLNRTISLFSVLGVIFGAGLGYVAYLKTGGAIGLPIRRGVAFPIQNISYPGAVPGFLVVQRAFFLGFPMFIISLWAYLKAIKDDDLKLMVVSGVIAGLLPLSHTHSFIAIVAVVGTGLIFFIAARNTLLFDIVRGFVFSSFIIAIPQLAALILLPKYSIGGIVSFRLGWMSGYGQVGGVNLASPDAPQLLPWLRYFWTNFGALLFLFPMTLLYLRKNKNNLLFVALVAGAAALWVIPNIFQFQTWDFDTNKFFAFAIVLSVAAAGLGIQSQRPTLKKKLAIIAFSVILLFSLPSSLIASFNNLRYRHENRVIILTLDERDTAAWLKENADENAVILSSAAILEPKTIQNPVVMLSGRKTTAGFMTWLYTHGIDFTERSAAINAFLRNPNGNLLKENGVPANYLLIDDTLRKTYPGIEQRVEETGYKMVYKNPSFSIISLNKPE